MRPWIFSKEFTARFVLVSLISCVYAGSVLINNYLLFSWAQDEPFRYWLSVPFGLRLLLIMLLGFSAVIGIGIASAAVYLSPIVPEVTHHPLAFVLGFAESLGVYLALRGYGAFTGIRFPWSGLTWRHIPLIAGLCSVVGAVVSNLVRLFFELGDPATIQRDIALSIFGDLTGALLLLAVLILVRKSYLAYERNEVS